MLGCRIYLADLIHDFSSKGPFTIPVNLGYLAAYLDKLFCGDLEVRLFKFPGELMKAIEDKPPHILGLSNYTWNLELNRKLGNWAKAKNPETIVVLGGPDYPVDDIGAAAYLAQRPAVDFYVVWQGESGFFHLVRRWLERGPEAMKSEPLAGCSYLHDSGRLVMGPQEPIVDLSQIPSPYLSGRLDEFFTGGMIPIIETNRGCPYSCTYCAWGTAGRRKVRSFPIERVLAELDYIASQPEKSDMLMLADANFGILPRDLDIARHLRHIRDAHSYPSFIGLAWAKSTPDRIQEIAELIKDMASVTSSFQSLDPQVQKNIKRTNLSFDEFRDIQEHFATQGVSSHTELILGLPGETKETHLSALRRLFETNISNIVCYNLRMIAGSEMSTPESREQWGLETRCRLVDGGFGSYDEVFAIEHEEMVVATKDMDMEEILFFRPIHFLIYFLWNYGYYKDLLMLLRSWDVNPVDFMIRLVKQSGSAPGDVAELFLDFTQEAREEWYANSEALVEHYSEPKRFAELAAGGFGKLNFKYMFRVLLECRNEFDSYLSLVAGEMLSRVSGDRAEKDAQLKQVMAYLAQVFVDFSRWEDGLPRHKILNLDYDILAWRQGGYRQSLTEYKRPDISLKFMLSEFQERTLTKRMADYKRDDLNQSLRKMVEYINTKDLLYKVDYA